jgi:hypothetical protein
MDKDKMKQLASAGAAFRFSYTSSDKKPCTCEIMDLQSGRVLARGTGPDHEPAFEAAFGQWNPNDRPVSPAEAVIENEALKKKIADLEAAIKSKSQQVTMKESTTKPNP